MHLPTEKERQLRQIYQAHFEGLFFYALHFLKQEAEAKDVVQEIFIRFWEKMLPPKQEEKAIKAYLYNSVRNACLNRLQRNRVHLLPIDKMQLDIVEEELLLFDESLIREIKEEISRMAPQTRNIITGILLQGKRYQEVAEELGISLNTVKSMLKSGMKHLRTHFSGREELLLFYMHYRRYRY